MFNLSDNATSVYGVKTQPAFIATVTTAGTAVQVSSTTTQIAGAYFKALSTNSGLVYLGDSTVSSTLGYGLSPGEQVFYPCSRLSDVYLDSASNGDKAYVWTIGTLS